MEKYRSFSITYKGSKHEDDAPCQDASTHLSTDTAAIAIVADGHGSTRCFRSDVGSDKAVEIAKNCIEVFIKETQKLPSEMTTHFIDRCEIEVSESKIALGNVVRKIIDKWFAAVMKDEEDHPLIEDQRLEGIDPKYKDRYTNDVDYRCHAYGATLMAAVMCENYWFGFQVGDGKCVVLYEDGSWDLPIPWDDKCTFNVTTSICDDDSLSRFRYWFGFSNDKGAFTEYGYGVNGEGKDYVRPNESRPLAIFVGSDGVEDSYPRIDNDKYIINFYRNRIVSLAESDFDAFEEEIGGLAKRFADRESTDDVSIAGIIGDVVGAADVAKMKRESEIHEAGEMASVKRRDADEKKDALATVQKRTDAVMANQRQLESRITSVEDYITSLISKKSYFDSALVNRKVDVETSNREMSILQSKVREFEKEKDKHAEDARLISAKINNAVSELKRAEKERNNREREFSAIQGSLWKKQEAYDKYLHKLDSEKLQTIVGQIQTINISQAKVTDYSFVGHGNDTIQLTMQIPTAYSATQPSNLAYGIVTDAKAEGLRQAVENITADMQNLQAQTTAAEQSVETKARERSLLLQQLLEAQQLTKKFESKIYRANQDYHMAEALNRNHREAVRQLQRNIAETESNITIKKSEIDKLKVELDMLREQTKKQTDTLTQIKIAWEKAESEAKALEETIQNNNNGGGA